MKFVAYIRVSRVGGRSGDTFISPDVQRESIERLAASRGWTIVDAIQDLDESGGKWERPGLQRALEMVESREADGIAVAKLDRFARSVVDGLRGIERITEAGGEFVSVAESFDTTTPIGRAMLQISLVFAELERERQREGFRVANVRAIERGVYVSATVPVGYTRGDDRHLVPDPVAAPIVREVFRRRASGTSWSALALYLDSELPRPNGGAWSKNTVAKLVANRAYLGEAHQGKIVNRKAHPAIVSRAEFEAAQQRRTGSRTRSGSLLAGVLTCGSCGRPLHRASSADYGCLARRSDGVCDHPVSIKVDRVDEWIDKVFRGWMASEGFKVEATPIDTSDEATKRVEDAEAELADFLARPSSGVPADVWQAAIDARTAAVDEARDALAAFSTVGASRSHDLAEMWPDLPMTERREMIRTAIRRVEVAPATNSRTPVADRCHIVWWDDPRA